MLQLFGPNRVRNCPACVMWLCNLMPKAVPRLVGANTATAPS